MAVTATIASTLSAASFNEAIPLLITLSNSGGADVHVQAIKLLVSYPADSSLPAPPDAVSNLDAVNTTIPAGGSAQVAAQANVFGFSKIGTYTIDAEITAIGVSTRCTSPVSVTLSANY